MSSPKTLTSYPPDLTVTVGSGRTKQRFKTYAALLSHASPVLDTMLSSGMKESNRRQIEFKTKDPEEFKLFLECIDPSSASRYYLEDEDRFGYYGASSDVASEKEKTALLNVSNVMKLAPWFHEYQMTGYLKSSDKVLSYGERGSYGFWGEGTDISTERSRLLELLSFCIKYNLSDTQEAVEKKLGDLLESFLWGRGDPNNVDIGMMKEIVQCCRPIYVREAEESEPAKKKTRSKKGVDEKKEVIYDSSCKTLWDQIVSCMDLTQFSLGMMNNDECFVHTVYFGLHRYHERMKSELRGLTSSFIGQKGPFYLTMSGDYEHDSIKIGGEQSKVASCDIQASIFDRPLTFKYDGCETLGNYHRQYRLSDCGRKVLMKWEHRGEYQQWRTDDPEKKEGERIQFCDPDLVVAIGNGADMKEFKCHGIILALASPKLDHMIAAASGKLQLPQMDPSSWEAFYNCIDPSANASSLNDYGYNSRYTSDLPTLPEWFLEFEMSNHLKCCEEIATADIDKWKNDYMGEGIHKQYFEMLNVLQFVVKLKSKELQGCVEDVFKGWFLRRDPFGWGPDIMDNISYYYVKHLVPLCLPIKRDPLPCPSTFSREYRMQNGLPDKYPFVSESCPVLWDALRSRIEKHLQNLTFDKVESSDSEMFSHLIYSFIRYERYKHDERHGSQYPNRQDY